MNFIKQYTKQCSIAQGGTCDVDVNECASSPCKNTARCVDSTMAGSGVTVDAYRCMCVAGFAKVSANKQASVGKFCN